MLQHGTGLGELLSESPKNNAFMFLIAHIVGEILILSSEALVLGRARGLHDKLGPRIVKNGASFGRSKKFLSSTVLHGIDVESSCNRFRKYRRRPPKVHRCGCAVRFGRVRVVRVRVCIPCRRSVVEAWIARGGERCAVGIGRAQRLINDVAAGVDSLSD